MLPELVPQGKIHCVVEGLFSRDTLPKVKLVGRSKHFLKNRKKLAGDKKILEIVEGYKISYHMNPFLVRVPHSQKMNRDQSTLVNQEIDSMLQKGAIKKVSHISGVFLSNLFLGDKSFRWRKEASDKPEKSKFVYIIPAIENGGPPSNKRTLAGTGVHVQDCSSRCIFCNTNKSKVQEIPQVQMGGKPVRVYLTLLWTRSSTSNIYKTNENPYFSNAAHKHSSNNIPG